MKAQQQQLVPLQQCCQDQEALRKDCDEMVERQKSTVELTPLSNGVTVVMSRECKLRKYGERGDEDFETWEADALVKEQCEFLYDRLGGG